MRNSKISGFNWKPILNGFLIILNILMVYYLYRISNSENRLIHLSVIALIAGAVIENTRLTGKWSMVLLISVISLILSYFSSFWFLTVVEVIEDIQEDLYLFSEHTAAWPYMYLLFFVLTSYAVNKNKIVPGLTEGITLILSVGIIYWVIDNGFHNTNSKSLKIIMVLGFLVAMFSIINAFINIKLTKPLRFFFSLWSSVILILLAVENICVVFQNGQIENSELLADKFNIGLQYFLLGICSVYILQNAMMILGFFPGKSRFFSKQYFRDARQLINEHIVRYSQNQSNFKLSISCLILSGGFLFINYAINFLPRNTAIWLVFFILNNVVYAYEFRKTGTISRKPSDS